MTERINAQTALARLAASGQRYVSVLERGGVEVEFYAPRGTDGQKPHTRDEYYFVISGTGEFVIEGKRHPFGPGEFFFAPAGVAHRFENFGDDFATWAIFVPPTGTSAP